jgi:apolipoprotein N-acyltransferase
MFKHYRSKILSLKKNKSKPPKMLGKKKWYKNPNSPGSLWRRINWLFWFKPIISGFLMGLSLPATFVQFPLARSFLAWFALIPLFNGLLHSKNYLSSFVQTFLAGLVLNLLGFRFLLGIHPLSWLGLSDSLSILTALTGWVLAALQGAFYWGIAGIFWHIVQKNFGLKFWWIALSSLIWVVWQEKIATLISNGGIPWTSLYYSQAHNLIVSQIAEFTGGSGMSFLLILVNASLAFYLWAGNPLSIEVFRQKSFLGWQAAALMLIVLGYGFICLSLNPDFGVNNPYQALAVQSNLNITDTRLPKSSVNKLTAFQASLASASNSESAVFIVSPEGSLNREQAEQFWQKTQKKHAVQAMISGVLEGKHNAALAFSKNAQYQTQIYIKQALVPFGEYMPQGKLFKGILHFFKLDYLAANSFEAGKEAKVFALPFGEIGASICFEILSPEITSRQVQAGAELLVLLADSSWFGPYQSLVNAQMLAAAKIRAIENRRAILLSINQGPAVSVNQFGKTIKYQASKQATFLPFNLQSRQTVFTQIQWQK